MSCDWNIWCLRSTRGEGDCTVGGRIVLAVVFTGNCIRFLLSVLVTYLRTRSLSYFSRIHLVTLSYHFGALYTVACRRQPAAVVLFVHKLDASHSTRAIVDSVDANTTAQCIYIRTHFRTSDLKRKKDSIPTYKVALAQLYVYIRARSYSSSHPRSR